MEWNGEGVPVDWGNREVGGGEPNASSSSSSFSSSPQTESNCRGQYEPLMSDCRPYLFKVKCHVVLLERIKYTLRPVCPPLSVNRSLMFCSFFFIFFEVCQL